MSRKQAIENKCKDCIYDECAPGTWRHQVSMCSVKTCPLWDYRPKAYNAPPESVLSQYGLKIDEYQDLVADRRPTRRAA